MKHDLLQQFLDGNAVSRRRALGVGALGALGATAALATPAAAAGAPENRDAAHPEGRRRPGHDTDFDDVLFDYADPELLDDWVPSRYGAGDQRGSFNEVTPRRTAEALAQLRSARTVKTYNLSEMLWAGFPAFATDPERFYDQRLAISGYAPPQRVLDDGAILMSSTPAGPNRVTFHEERFAGRATDLLDEPVSTTFQIGTQIDNLNHAGAGEFFYNGFRGPEIAAGHGTTRLGGENMGPIVTRGLVLDVLGLKLDQDDAEALGAPAQNGEPVLRGAYRITVEDLQAAMRRQRLRSIEPGDAVLIRTGWNQLLALRDERDLDRWRATEGMPGIYLREARWLAQFRPALIGSDTWALEVLGHPITAQGEMAPVHQELLMRHGIRIGESFVLDALVEDGQNEFVFCASPQYAEGSTAGNTPPFALAAEPRKR